ncbi:MAG: hypothetical protein H0Z39_11560 [Peptococcaceae bacterium]|nr:hypothetical protein [Peptococcaceae bacterium]
MKSLYWVRVLKWLDGYFPRYFVGWSLIIAAYIAVLVVRSIFLFPIEIGWVFIPYLLGGLYCYGVYRYWSDEDLGWIFPFVVSLVPVLLDRLVIYKFCYSSQMEIAPGNFVFVHMTLGGIISIAVTIIVFTLMKARYQNTLTPSKVLAVLCLLLIPLVAAGIVWANLAATVSPDDIDLKAELVRTATIANPVCEDASYAVEVSLDKSTDQPLFEDGKYRHTIHLYVDGFLFKECAEGLRGHDSALNMQRNTIAQVVKELSSLGIDYPHDILASDLLGFMYTGENLPARTRHYLSNRRIVKYGVPCTTVQTNEQPHSERSYAIYAHHEIRWGKDLSWVKTVPIEDRTGPGPFPPEMMTRTWLVTGMTAEKEGEYHVHVFSTVNALDYRDHEVMQELMDWDSGTYRSLVERVSFHTLGEVARAKRLLNINEEPTIFVVDNRDIVLRTSSFAELLQFFNKLAESEAVNP